MAVQAYRTVGSFSYGSGTVSLVETSNPLDNPLPTFVCYAAVADWRPERTPVGMLVTVFLRPSGIRQIHLVYADVAFRRMAGKPRVTVAVGRFLFAGGFCTEHSPDRNEAGDCWAKEVGGFAPDRHEVQQAGEAERDGVIALARLNELLGTH